MFIVSAILQPKIPERRKTPVKMKSLEKQKLRLPSPDRNCSPAVTRFKKAVAQVIATTPEVLKQARLAKQLKKNQQGKFTILVLSN